MIHWTLVEFLILQFTSIPLVYLQIEQNDKIKLCAQSEIWTISKFDKLNTFFYKFLFCHHCFAKSAHCIIYERSIPRCYFWKENPKWMQILKETLILVFGTALPAIRVTILFRTIKLQPSNAMYHIWYARHLKVKLIIYILKYKNCTSECTV